MDQLELNDLVKKKLELIEMQLSFLERERYELLLKHDGLLARIEKLIKERLILLEEKNGAVRSDNVHGNTQ